MHGHHCLLVSKTSSIKRALALSTKLCQIIRHEYRDLQLLLALTKHTTCTFHFPGIGEVMLTPYEFSIITGLRLGRKRILVNHSFTSTELKKLLGVMPFRMRSNNIPLSWLCENIPQCKIVAKGARMFMLLFIRTFLCLDLGSTVNLRYLGSLRKIEKIQNYDWGGMAYATLMHFMTQLPLKLGWGSICMAGEVWYLFGYVGCGKSFWLCCNDVVKFSSLDV